MHNYWALILLFVAGGTEGFSLSGKDLSIKFTQKVSSVGTKVGYNLSSAKLHAQEVDVVESDEEQSVTSSTSLNFAIHPDSEEAHSITSNLGLNEAQHQKLTKLTQLIVKWNGRLNLISRKDCTLEVVFGRHIIPSIAIAGIPDTPLNVKLNGGDSDDKELGDDDASRKMVVDVGTGGGFPGLPLAIIFPNIEFLLVDSVGKKLKAVQEMSDELGLKNIKTHHGRVEELLDDSALRSKYKQTFDVIVGRSVSALPRFCFWVNDLLKPREKGNEGKLVYIIGGDIEENLLELVENDIPIDEILQCDGASDKRTLVIRAQEVSKIADESGETRQKRGAPNKKKKQVQRTRDTTKGSWDKKDNSAKKNRGYENFKRY
mmetsp:Transcript_18707/g.18017  ORF Transcript_18707/g.18017 Transcript_18707/m.18017 type:complete len:374 (-) Transcript_18707:5-1126(-)